MFAVPGWAVSAASLTTQTDSSNLNPFPAKEVLSNERGGSDAVQKRGRKRKRLSGGQGSEAVTDQNLGRLWSKYIEGGTGEGEGGSAGLKKRRRKKTRGSGSDKPSVSGDAQKETVPHGREEPKAGKHKRERDSNDEPLPHTSTSVPANAHRADNHGVPIQGLSVTNEKSMARGPQSIESARRDRGRSTLTPLQQKMREKLTAARFRHLNETLYTCPSARAKDLFDQNPDFFDEYHAGFSQQVKEWPENPIDGYIAKFQSTDPADRKANMSKKHSGDGVQTSEALPRTRGVCTVADLGCGDASLARSLARVKRSSRLRVFSYDFRESNEFVTVADISNLPLEDRTVDVAIFCLSLMGTNWIECIEEAWRVLRFGGECWISEVKSRFGRVHRPKRDQKPISGKKQKQKPVDEDDTDDADEAEVFEENKTDDADGTNVSAFVEVVERRGFKLRPGSIDRSNRMFVRMEFTKGSSPIMGKYSGPERRVGDNNVSGGTWKRRTAAGIVDQDINVERETKVLKPCVYKIR